MNTSSNIQWADPLLDQLSINQAWIQSLQDYPRSQVMVTNLTTQPQPVRLWGANQQSYLDNTLPAIVTGNYPQAVLFNPANQYVYVANQLSNTIQVFDEFNQTLKTIELEPLFPGFTSPVAMTVNPVSGEVYVAGSISNTIYVISDQLSLDATIQVALRPIALHFHSGNGKLYVAHLSDHLIGVINTQTRQVEQYLPTGLEPRVITSNPLNGNWFACNAGDSTVHVFNAQDQLLGVVNTGGNYLIAAAYHSTNDRLYVLARGSAELIEINVSLLAVTTSIPLTGVPTTLAIHQTEGSLIIGNQSEHTLTILANDLTVINELSAVTVKTSMAIDPIDGTIYLTDPTNNQLTQQSLDGSTDSPIEFSENYPHVVQDFQFNPVLLKHVKAVFSGDKTSPNIWIGNKSPGGRDKKWSLSLAKHQSPQKRLNIAELIELENEIIDGRTYWDLVLLPSQKVTLLLYYQQIEREKIQDDINVKYERDERVNTVRPKATWNKG